MDTSIKRTQTPKKYLKWSFLLLPTCIKWTLEIKFHHPTVPGTGNAKDCLKLPPTNFSIYTLKNVTWRSYLISFTVQYCFLFRFVCIELVSLICKISSNLSCKNYLCLWYYDQLVHFDKEVNARISS